MRGKLTRFGKALGAGKEGGERKRVQGIKQKANLYIHTTVFRTNSLHKQAEMQRIFGQLVH